MNIRSIDDYLNHAKADFLSVWKSLGTSLAISKEQAEVNFMTAKRKEYTEKIKPFVDSIGGATGQQNSLLNPIRTVTNVAIYNGCPCVFFKAPRQKLERYEKLV